MTITLEKNAENTTKHQQWGTRFKTAREAMHLSEKEVAARLHLKSHVISLIEAEAFEDGPPAIFMRGYLRSYGKLLNFTEKEIDQALAQLSLENPAIKATTTTTLRPRTSAMPNQSNNSYTGITTALIVVVMMALVGMWWTNHPRYSHSELAKQTTQVPVIPSPATVATAQPSTPAANTTPPTANPSDPVPQELIDNKSVTTIEEAPVTTAAANNAPNAPIAQTRSSRSEELTPPLQPDNNLQQADTGIAEDLPLSGPAAMTATPDTTSPVLPKKKHRHARNHSDSAQELALPEAGLEGEGSAQNSDNLF